MGNSLTRGKTLWSTTSFSDHWTFLKSRQELETIWYIHFKRVNYAKIGMTWFLDERNMCTMPRTKQDQKLQNLKDQILNKVIEMQVKDPEWYTQVLIMTNKKASLNFGWTNWNLDALREQRSNSIPGMDKRIGSHGDGIISSSCRIQQPVSACRNGRCWSRQSCTQFTPWTCQILLHAILALQCTWNLPKGHGYHIISSQSNSHWCFGTTSSSLYKPQKNKLIKFAPFYPGQVSIRTQKCAFSIKKSRLLGICGRPRCVRACFSYKKYMFWTK